jgi:hypothetical protein
VDSDFHPAEQCPHRFRPSIPKSRRNSLKISSLGNGSLGRGVALRIGLTFGRLPAMTFYIAGTMRKYKVGDHLEVKLSGGRIVNAVIKAVFVFKFHLVRRPR